MIELGGNIVLEGFDAKDFTELIVVKKMVGQYARKLTDTVGKVEKLSVSLTQEDSKHVVTVALTLDGNEQTSSTSMDNLYMALDMSLKEVLQKAS